MPRLELDIAVDRRPVTDGGGGGTTDGMAGDGPRVSGTVLGPDGQVSAFVGWVGLLALLQQAIAEPVPDVPDPSPTPGTG